MLRAAGTPVNSAIVIASAKGMTTKNLITSCRIWGSHCFDRFVGKIITYQNGHVVQKGINYTVEVITTRVESRRAAFLQQVTEMVKVCCVSYTGPSSPMPIFISINHSLHRSMTYLPIQLLYHGKTERVHPQYKFPAGFDMWHTHNHWASQQTTVHYIEGVIIPYIQRTWESKQLANKPALVIFDVFKYGEYTSCQSTCIL